MASLCYKPLPADVLRVGGGSGGAEGQELAGGGVCLRFLLGILEIAVVQEHLFSRLEGWHPKVGAVGASESVP